MNNRLLVYDPVAQESDAQQARKPLAELAGKVVGFIDNGKPNFHYLVDDLAELLTSKYGVKATLKRRKRGPSVPAPDAIIKEICEHCDAVVTGSGD